MSKLTRLEIYLRSGQEKASIRGVFFSKFSMAGDPWVSVNMKGQLNNWYKKWNLIDTIEALNVTTRIFEPDG